MRRPLRILRMIIVQAIVAAGASILWVWGAATAQTGATLSQPPPGQPDFAAVPEKARLFAASLTIALTSERSQCLGTIVGPRAVITTGYCTDGKVTGVMPSDRTKGDRKPIDLTCTTDTPSQRQGLALCVASEDLPTRDFADFAAPSQVALGTQVLSIGGSCGLSMAQPLTFRNHRVTAYSTMRSPTGDLAPVIQLRGSEICPGDGGGGVFVVGGNELRLIGVISASLGHVGLATPLDDASAIQTLKRLAEPRSVAICGLGPFGPQCQPHHATAASRIDESSNRIAVPWEKARIAVDGVIPKVRYRKGETLAALLTRLCGVADEDYLRLVRASLATRSDPVTGAKETFLSDGTLDLPACRTGRDAVAVKTAAKGDTLWKYFKTEADGSSWKAFESLGEAVATSASFQDSIRALNPKTLSLDRPEIGKLVTIPRTPLQPVTAERPNRPDTEGIVALASGEVDGASCPTPESQPYPFDVTRLLDVLASNARTDDDRDTATVLIADSGLYVSKYGAFGPRIVFTGATDKVVDYLKSLEPLQDGEKPSHGTQVASIVLGGPLLAKIGGMGVGRPRIRIRALRIYRQRTVQLAGGGEAGFIDVDTDSFSRIADEARSHISIVNLSVKSNREIDTLRNVMTGNNGVLFVVAAGNDGVLLNDRNFTIPAMYGGPQSSQVITVGAVDGAARWAKGLSNFGPDYIEIAAPGCGVPALSYANRVWSVERLYGTSMAAPIVTFAAALLKSEVGEWRAPDIKRRLLIASDVDPVLAPQVRHGRILNVVRALSLNNDAITLERGKLRFGQATIQRNGISVEKSAITFDCIDRGRDLVVSQIVKISPKFLRAGAKDYALIDYRPSGRVPDTETATCAIPPDLTLAFDDAESGSTETIDLSALIDFTRKAL